MRKTNIDLTEVVATLVLCVVIGVLALTVKDQSRMLEELDAALVSQITRIDSVEARQYIFLKPLVEMHFTPTLPRQQYPSLPRTDR